MKCKICGSEDVVKENEHYVCKSCGSVFYEAPEDDGDEVIKGAKEAIEAKEAEEAAKKAHEQEVAAEAEKILKEREAAAAEKALKTAEENSYSSNVKEIPLSEVFKERDKEAGLEAKEEKKDDSKETEDINKILNSKKSEESAKPEKIEVPDSADEVNENDIEVEEEVKTVTEPAPEKEEAPKSEGAKEETEAPEVKIFKKGEPLYKAEKMADDFIPETPAMDEDKEEKKAKKSKKNKKSKKEKNGELEAKAMNAEAVTVENIDDMDEKKKKSPMREVLDFCLPIIIALVIAMLLKSCVFANAQVPTGSMLNTIQEGDRIIASRLEYKFHDPERYDVVIFKFPDDVAAHEKDKSVKVEYFVKRIIGLPGETVTIVNGVVYVTDKDGNTQQLRDDFVTACVPTGNYGPYKVPEDSYFVLGDNRESSIDSRFWETTNYVKRDLLVGKVKFRYYPSIGKIE